MIPVYKPFLGEVEKKYVNDCLDSSWISSKGEYIDRFEKQFAEYINVEYATTVGNGTVALHLALEALGITAGDEVIVPTFTYVASVNTILQCGAKVVFVDSLADSWQVDPMDIEKKITARTKAVMAVHLYGLPCDMHKIKQICIKNNLYLIEDCAEAFGTYYNDVHVGNFGDVATFSFFGNKTITTGEGGMVVMKNKEIYDKAKHLKNQGVSSEKEYWHDTLAFNYRMTNICAAIGLAQLEKADEILEKKRQIALWYKKYLQALPIIFHDELAGTRHSYWMCSLLVKTSEIRHDLRQYLKGHAIETRPTFYPAHTMPHCKTDGSFPVAEDISQRGINLPSYPELTKENIEFICMVIKQYYGGMGQVC